LRGRGVDLLVPMITACPKLVIRKITYLTNVRNPARRGEGVNAEGDEKRKRTTGENLAQKGGQANKYNPGYCQGGICLTASSVPDALGREESNERKRAAPHIKTKLFRWSSSKRKLHHGCQ